MVLVSFEASSHERKLVNGAPNRTKVDVSFLPRKCGHDILRLNSTHFEGFRHFLILILVLQWSRLSMKEFCH